jgi:hypothetical protein
MTLMFLLWLRAVSESPQPSPSQARPGQARHAEQGRDSQMGPPSAPSALEDQDTYTEYSVPILDSDNLY